MDKPKPDLVYDVQSVKDYLHEKYKLSKSVLMRYIQETFNSPAQNTIVTINNKELENSDCREYIETLLHEFGSKNSYDHIEVQLEYWW